MRRVMRASGAESLNVAASIFMGQTEAPLTIRPYLPKMTESELMTVMTSGMAHISGGIMAAYIAFGVEPQHLLTAVIMTAPGTLMIAKMIVPETQVPETMGTVKLDVEKTDVNVIDAAGRGTTEGLHLALNVAAMLISFLALIALVNHLLGFAGLSSAADLRLGLRAGGLGDGRSLARRAHHRSSARHTHGDQRVRGVLAARSAEADARSTLVHDRHVCVVRLRQLQLDRDSDRGDRRARAEPPARPRAAWRARHAGGDARKLRDRDDRGVPAVMAQSTPRSQTRARPT